MAYALQPLLRIRERREDRAGAELTAARNAVAEAERILAERKRDLEEFEAGRDARRDRIFATVMGRVVSMDDMELVREGVARIDEEGVLKADNVVQAQDVVKRKEALAAEAKAHFTQATKNRMKITEHREIWMREEQNEQEHRQESELEDFTGKKIIDEEDFRNG